MADWIVEEVVGEFTFRVRPAKHACLGYYGEAVRGAFTADDILAEPFSRDCWFEYAMSPDIVLRNLKREVLH